MSVCAFDLYKQLADFPSPSAAEIAKCQAKVQRDFPERVPKVPFTRAVTRRSPFLVLNVPVSWKIEGLRLIILNILASRVKEYWLNLDISDIDDFDQLTLTLRLQAFNSQSVVSIVS